MAFNVLFAQAFVDFDVVNFFSGGLGNLTARAKTLLRDQETLSYLLLAVSVLLVWRLIALIRWSRPDR